MSIGSISWMRGEVYPHQNQFNEEYPEYHKKMNQENHFIQKLNKKMSLEVDEETRKFKVKVYDYITGEVIEEIPSHIFLEYLKNRKLTINPNIDKFDLGLFIDDKS